MNKRAPRKISLHRETLRNMTRGDLIVAAGGLSATCPAQCPSQRIDTCISCYNVCSDACPTNPDICGG